MRSPCVCRLSIGYTVLKHSRAWRSDNRAVSGYDCKNAVPCIILIPGVVNVGAFPFAALPFWTPDQLTDDLKAQSCGLLLYAHASTLFQVRAATENTCRPYCFGLFASFQDCLLLVRFTHSVKQFPVALRVRIVHIKVECGNNELRAVYPVRVGRCHVEKQDKLPVLHAGVFYGIG